MPSKVENRITFLVVFAVLVGAADDAGDVHALPLEVDRLRGLLEPLAHDLEGRLAELGLDLWGHSQMMSALRWEKVYTGFG